MYEFLLLYIKTFFSSFYKKKSKIYKLETFEYEIVKTKPYLFIQTFF